MNKKTVKILAIVLVALIVVAGVIAIATKVSGNAGSKKVTIEVYVDGALTKTYTEKTNAEFLGELLTEKKIASGPVTEYGLYITEVAGITADDANQEWWCITKGGEMLFTGADTTPIADGEVYELTLTVGYDF